MLSSLDFTRGRRVQRVPVAHSACVLWLTRPSSTSYIIKSSHAPADLLSSQLAMDAFFRLRATRLLSLPAARGLGLTS